MVRAITAYGELYRAVTRATTVPVIATGGISAIGDLVVLAEVAAAGANLEGAIVGKALYAAGPPCPRRWRHCGSTLSSLPGTVISCTRTLERRSDGCRSTLGRQLVRSWWNLGGLVGV